LSAGSTRVKVFRANHNGFQFGLVNEGPWHATGTNGLHTFNDVVTGVQAGDWVGYVYTNVTWGGVGSEGFAVHGPRAAYPPLWARWIRIFWRKPLRPALRESEMIDGNFPYSEVENSG
jgi:hypothetical protein